VREELYTYTSYISGQEGRKGLRGDRSVGAFSIVNGKVIFTCMESVYPAELYVYDGKICKITGFNENVNNTLALIKPEHFFFKGSDGKTIERWMLKPTAVNKVPAILYVHGGPKTEFGYAYMHEFQVLASKGYAVYYANS
jgi:acylaminoacyl-peptidase